MGKLEEHKTPEPVVVALLVIQQIAVENLMRFAEFLDASSFKS